jgi:hypothetical protein
MKKKRPSTVASACDPSTQRQEDHVLKASLGYMKTPSLKNKIKQQQKEKKKKRLIWLGIK